MEYNRWLTGANWRVEWGNVARGCVGRTAVAESMKKAGEALEREEIALSLHCRGCGYNLRGLRAGGKCPECGLDVFETVLSTVDPAASRLPQLRDPNGVGDALVWLASCLLVTTLLQLAGPVAAGVDRLLFSGRVVVGEWTPSWLMWVAGCVVLVALWSVWKLAPPWGKEPQTGVWRDLWLMAAGLATWGMLSIGAWYFHRSLSSGWGAGGAWRGQVIPAAFHFVGIGAVILILAALRDVLRVIGERSREYRSARGGRQRVRDMIAAAIGIAAGEVLRVLGQMTGTESLQMLGAVVTGISTLMLVIGLVYLLVNAWWIRRALRRPPPTLRELFGAKSAEEEGAESGEGGERMEGGQESGKADGA